MSDDPGSSSDLWGWLVPGLGLAVVGVALLLINSAPIAAPMIIFGLVLCLVGLVKHQRALRR